MSTLVSARNDKDLSNRINRGVAVCDSKIIEFALRIFFPKYRRIRGVDFLRTFLILDSPDNKHFFLGGNQETLLQVKKVVTELFPKTEVVEMFSPPFSELIDWKGCCSTISSTGASIIWVSLGSPKQDIVASQISEFLEVRVTAIGAVVDFFSNRKQEAPKLIQNLGLEWLFRLLSEPRRLRKRYILGNSVFLLHLPMQIMKNLVKFGKE